MGKLVTADGVEFYTPTVGLRKCASGAQTKKPSVSHQGVSMKRVRCVAKRGTVASYGTTVVTRVHTLGEAINACNRALEDKPEIDFSGVKMVE